MKKETLFRFKGNVLFSLSSGEIQDIKREFPMWRIKAFSTGSRELLLFMEDFLILINRVDINMSIGTLPTVTIDIISSPQYPDKVIEYGIMEMMMNAKVEVFSPSPGFGIIGNS